MTSSALIELTLLLPISLGVTAAGVLCTALYCIVLHCTAGAVITAWRLCVGAALSNNTHSQLTPWDRSSATNGWDFSPPIIFGSHSVMLYCVMTMSCYEM